MLTRHHWSIVWGINSWIYPSDYTLNNLFSLEHDIYYQLGNLQMKMGLNLNLQDGLFSNEGINELSISLWRTIFMAVR